MTPEREAVLKVILEATGPISGKAIARSLGKKPGAIRKMLFILKGAGQVKPAGYGLWISGNASGNGLTLLPITLAPEGKRIKTGNALGKTVTVSGNALKQPGQVELSEEEKARIAFNVEQRIRINRPEQKAKRKEYNRKWREAHREYSREYGRKWRKEHPEKAKASKIKQYAKKYEELTRGGGK